MADSFAMRRLIWEGQRDLAEEERARLAELNKRPAPNPSELFTPTRCKVLRPFCVAGRRLEVNEIVTLQRHDALSMQALGKVNLED